MRAVAPFGIVAHRGVTAGMRENSVEAFRRAMEVGVDAVELDARLTVTVYPSSYTTTTSTMT